MNKKYTYVIAVIAIIFLVFLLTNKKGGDPVVTDTNGENQSTTTPTGSNTVSNSTSTPTVGENPTGEADPMRMTLAMNTWKWQRTVYADGKIVTPIQKDRFTVKFLDGYISLGTDCNSAGGQFTASTSGSLPRSITLGALASTKMYCEDSQEQIYMADISEIEKYTFTDRGEMILSLKGDKGEMFYR